MVCDECDFIFYLNPKVAAGVLVAVLGLRAAGQRSIRTSYRPDPWRAPEWATAAAGALVAAAFLTTPTTELVLSVTPLGWPAPPAATMAAVLLAAGPAAWTPPLPRPRGVAA